MSISFEVLQLDKSKLNNSFFFHIYNIICIIFINNFNLVQLLKMSLISVIFEVLKLDKSINNICLTIFKKSVKLEIFFIKFYFKFIFSFIFKIIIFLSSYPLSNFIFSLFIYTSISSFEL